MPREGPEHGRGASPQQANVLCILVQLAQPWLNKFVEVVTDFKKHHYALDPMMINGLQLLASWHFDDHYYQAMQQTQMLCNRWTSKTLQDQ